LDSSAAMNLSRMAGFFLLAAASPAHYLEIKLSPGMISENVFIRYVLARDELGGWVQPRAGVSSYFISTSHEGRPASGIKALLYAPGCGVQTLDLPVSDSNNQQYSFTCKPLSSVRIAGTLTHAHRLYGRAVKVEARYVARWAQAFLKLHAGILTAIPVGDVASVSTDGRFRLSVPDFSEDPLAGAPDHPGEIQIWARDKTSAEIVAQLIPAGPQDFKTRMGGLKIQSEYPAETNFVPCAVNPHQLRDRFGFAVRTDADDGCER
jgi:hypothetical protein